MNRRAIVGHGRLLTMRGARTGENGLIEGPWVVLIEGDTIVEVRPGRLPPDDPDLVEDVGPALVTPGHGRSAHAPHLRRRPLGRGRSARARRALHRRRHPAHGGGHDGGRRRRSSCARHACDCSPRAPGARPRSRSSPATASKPPQSCACSAASRTRPRVWPCACAGRTWVRMRCRPAPPLRSRPWPSSRPCRSWPTRPTTSTCSVSRGCSTSS